MAKRRKVSNLLALVVLTLAYERPMHPYEMATLLRERHKDRNLKINWGSLYTVVGNLERHGFLTATATVRSGRRPERTVYAITEAGHAELRDWLQELMSTPEREPRRFTVALSLLGALPPAEAVALLRDRERRLRAHLADRRRDLDKIAQEVPRIFLVEEEYELALQQAEADWLGSLLTEIEDGTLAGVDLWHGFHETGQQPDGGRREPQ